MWCYEDYVCMNGQSGKRQDGNTYKYKTVGGYRVNGYVTFPRKSVQGFVIKQQ